jgi:hypothetical protein
LSTKELIIYLPLLTAVITALLTFVLNSLKERKNTSFSNRVFLEYEEVSLRVPFEKDVKDRVGNGTVYWGKESNKIRLQAEETEDVLCSFFILKNPTKNDCINLKVVSEYRSENEMVKEDFAIPYWESNKLVYLPTTVHGSNDHISIHERFEIQFTTKSFEHFRFSIIRSSDGNYNKKLAKKYFNLFWITKVRYPYVGLLHVEKIQ